MASSISRSLSSGYITLAAFSALELVLLATRDLGSGSNVNTRLINDGTATGVILPILKSDICEQL